MSISRRRRLSDFSAAAAVVVLIGWFTVPFLPVALWAATDTWNGATPLPQEWGRRGFVDAWDAGAGPALLRSTALAVAVAALATPVGATLARATLSASAPARRLITGVVLAPVVVPLFAVVMGLNVVVLRLHVPAAVAIVVILGVAALPYTTYVMRLAYTGYDPTFDEEARTLGARPSHIRWRVRLPLLRRAFAAAAFLAFLVGWSDYVVTLLVGGGQFLTVPVLLAAAASGSGNDPAVASLAVAAVLPPAALMLTVAAVDRRPHRSRQPMPGRPSLEAAA